MHLWGNRNRQTRILELIVLVGLWTLLALLVGPSLGRSVKRAVGPPRRHRPLPVGMTSRPARTPSMNDPHFEDRTGELLDDPGGLQTDLETAVVARVWDPPPIEGSPAPWTPPRDPGSASPRASADARRAELLLSELQSLEEAVALSPAGWWRNTYRPHDPELRWLRSHLNPQDRSRFAALARRPRLPLDPPQGSALQVFLSSNRTSIEERQRLLVQIGLTGIPRRRGRRPPMNVALVLDLRGGLERDEAERARALALALARCQDVGDLFHLLPAGRSETVAVRPDNYRHGAVQLALDQLLDPGAVIHRPVLDLPEALISAFHRLTDRSSTSPSGLILLVTAQPLPEPDRILELASACAAAGVAVSVISLKSDGAPAEHDAVALAGHGRHRSLGHPDQAQRLIEAELRSGGRAVARAVRLSVRLAPGIQLLDVVGTAPLGISPPSASGSPTLLGPELAQRLGVSQGDPSESIQILIPAFEEGDQYEYLLDLVVEGPGDVAEVTLRYRDLVWMTDRVHRTQLAVGSEARSSGALQVAVLKSLLTLRLARALDHAARLVGDAKPDEASDALAWIRSALTGIPEVTPGLLGDPDLQRSDELLQQCERLLEGDTDREYTERVLRYAHRRLLVAPPN